jgi:hypothetical protein
MAATGAAEAIQTKMNALSTQLAPRGPAIRQAGAAAAAALTAQDVVNSTRLPSVPTVPTPSGPGIQGLDRTWKRGPSGDGLQNAYDRLKDAIREHNSRYPSVTAETAPAYNREADALNREKGELEGKLGKSETAPARMSRLVPDWAHPPPEQPHTPAPAQPRSPMDLSTPHAYDLGRDPAVGKFRPGEAETGLRVEQERGIDLIRNQHPGADWINVETGETYDAVGNFPAQYFDRQWPNLQEEILDHLKWKAKYVPVDVSQFTPAQRALVRAFVDGLKNPLAFIVRR